MYSEKFGALTAFVIVDDPWATLFYWESSKVGCGELLLEGDSITVYSDKVVPEDAYVLSAAVLSSSVDGIPYDVAFEFIRDISRNVQCGIPTE